MRVGILGSGLMGGTLGTLFARGGHEVIFSYARGEQRLERLAREAAGNTRAGTPGEAARMDANEVANTPVCRRLRTKITASSAAST
jgi:predicted dinucleotide-binding enzyme